MESRSLSCQDHLISFPLCLMDPFLFEFQGFFQSKTSSTLNETSSLLNASGIN